MKTKTLELIGQPLNWAVAKGLGFDSRNNCVVYFVNPQDNDDELQFSCMADDEDHAKEQLKDAYPESEFVSAYWPDFNPSTDWAMGGPIIEREHISLIDTFGGPFWRAERLDTSTNSITAYGPTPLVAAMRCYVASKLGDEVEIPEDLCQPLMGGSVFTFKE